ncbi:Hypothetical predicted protein [Octopus vulgaris]|uniref:Uncharacterized protein n=1 Tax=Octopus vulgaris TaxID=6645 RepID=A0AA36FED2_OCTVU|nr:Hypothetical predicted protein [Octopus vulgaris]
MFKFIHTCALIKLSRDAPDTGFVPASGTHLTKTNAVKEVDVISFLKCVSGNALDVTEDDLLFEEDTDDPDPIAENSSDDESRSSIVGNTENE